VTPTGWFVNEHRPVIGSFVRTLVTICYSRWLFWYREYHTKKILKKLNNGQTKISNVKMLDEIYEGCWPLIKALFYSRLCQILYSFSHKGKCPGWLCKVLFCNLHMILPTVTNNSIIHQTFSKPCFLQNIFEQ